MKYRVEFTETITNSCIIEVEADSEEHAEALVRSMDTDAYKQRDEVDAELHAFSFEETDEE